MADVDIKSASATTSPAVISQGSAKKEKKIKNPRAKPSHPPTSEMVNNAIKGLKERGGSSLQAIKKYVGANYKVDADKVGPFIKKYLKGAVAAGSLIQTKGKGASGSFKLASTTSAVSRPASGDKNKSTTVRRKKAAAASTSKTVTAAPKVKTVKKLAVSPGPKKSGTKKAVKPKKVTASVKKSTSGVSTTAATIRAPSKARSPSKVKKSNKAGPTKKPRAPIPKTAKSVAKKTKKATTPRRKK